MLSDASGCDRVDELVNAGVADWARTVIASLGSTRYAATRPYRIQSLDDKVRPLNEDLTVQTTQNLCYRFARSAALKLFAWP